VLCLSTDIRHRCSVVGPPDRPIHRPNSNFTDLTARKKGVSAEKSLENSCIRANSCTLAGPLCAIQ
jgi:hypothetical protein